MLVTDDDGSHAIDEEYQECMNNESGHAKFTHATSKKAEASLNGQSIAMVVQRALEIQTQQGLQAQEAIEEAILQIEHENATGSLNMSWPRA